MLSTLGTFQSIIPYTNSSSTPTFALNTTNLLLRYNMAHSGTTVTDQMGNVNGTATATNLFQTTPIVSADMGNSFGLLDGVTRNRITTNANLTSANRNYTISVWIYCTGSPTGGDCKIIELDHSEGMLLFQNNNTNNYSWCYLNTFSLNQNVWNHLVFIDDYTNVQKKVYVNGTDLGFVSYTGNTGFFASNATWINAGSSIGCSIASGHKPFKGYISDVRIYNRILSGTEITAIYQKTA